MEHKVIETRTGVPKPGDFVILRTGESSWSPIYGNEVTIRKSLHRFEGESHGGAYLSKADGLTLAPTELCHWGKLSYGFSVISGAALGQQLYDRFYRDHFGDVRWRDVTRRGNLPSGTVFTCTFTYGDGKFRKILRDWGEVTVTEFFRRTVGLQIRWETSTDPKRWDKPSVADVTTVEHASRYLGYLHDEGLLRRIARGARSKGIRKAAHAMLGTRDRAAKRKAA